MSTTNTRSAAALLTAFGAVLSSQNWESVEDHDVCTSDFELHITPKSLGIPVVTRAMFPATGKALFTGKFAPGALKFTINEVFEGKDESIATIRAESNGVSVRGNKWHNEYIYIVEIDVAQNKIRKLVEHLDSAFMKEWNKLESASRL